jgi:hypothetical protein
MGAWPAWPSWPAEEEAPEETQPNRAYEDQGREPAHAVIGEMARLLSETRADVLAGTGILAAIAIGMALEAGYAATRAQLPVIFRVINIGLMLGLVCCWLTAMALLAIVGRPTFDALSELRWKTGSPLDPRASWLTLPAAGDNPDQWTWTRAHLLLAAARLTRYRVHRSDTWTYATACCFIVWTVIIMTGH